MKMCNENTVVKLIDKKKRGRPVSHKTLTNAQRQKNYRDRKKMEQVRQNLTLQQIYNKTLKNHIDLNFLVLDSDEFTMTIKEEIEIAIEAIKIKYWRKKNERIPTINESATRIN